MTAPGASGEDARPLPVRSIFFSFGGLLLLALVCLEFWPVALGRIPFPADVVVGFPVWEGSRPAIRRPPHAELGDIATQFYPWRVRVVSELHRFRFPLWNDAILLGCPMLANTQSGTFSPVHLLTSLLPPRLAWGASIPFGPLIAGAGAALLVGELGGTLTGSWLAGIVFAFSGFLTGWRGRPQEATGMWLPLAIFAIERLRRRGDARGMLLAAAVGSLPLLGGHPEVAFQMGSVALSFALFRLFFSAAGDEPAGGRVAYARRLLLAGGGAAILCLLQLGPSLEWVLRLQRSLKGSWGHMPLEWSRTFLSRDLLANPNAHGLPIPRAAAYAGMSTLLLAPFAFRHSRRREAVFFAITLFVALEIVFGVPPFYGLSRHLPILSALPNATFLLAADLALAVLAGLGLSAIDWNTAPARGRMVTALLVAGLGSCAAWAVYRIRPPRGAPIAHSFLARTRPTEGWIVLAVAAVGAAALASPRRRKIGAGVVLLVTAADLFTFQHGMLPFVESDRVFPPAPALTFLREKAVEGARVGTTNLTMGSNFEMMYGLKTPGGYDFRLRRTARVLTAIGSPGGHLTLDAAKIAASPPHGLFDLLGTRYLLASTRNSGNASLESRPERFSLVYRERSIRIYENLTALPRAFVAPWRAVRRPDTEKAEFFTVASRSFDARRDVILPAGAPVPASVPPGSPEEWSPATAFSETPGEVSFSVDSPSGGVAVVTQSHYPGWKAWVDGEPATVFRADFAFQGIPVPPGRHRILLRYQPGTFRICLLVSMAGWLAWASLMVWSRRRSNSLATS